MAKKSRRVRRKGAPPRLSEAQLVRPVAPVTPRATASDQAADKGRLKTDEPVSFEEEYRYVIQDLRRIFALAAVILLALVALSFVL